MNNSSCSSAFFFHRATLDGTLYLTWIAGRFQRSTDHGDSWDSKANISGVNQGTGIDSAENGLLHITHHHTNNQMVWTFSDNYGETLTGGESLGDMGSGAFNAFPRDYMIVATGCDPTGTVVATSWAAKKQGGDGDADVWVMISEDAGASWSDMIKANEDASGRQLHPWVDVDAAGQVHAFWTDLRADGSGVDIYYSLAPSAAAGFGEDIKINDGSASVTTGFEGDYNGLAVWGNDVYMTWADYRNGDGDVYFARGIHCADGTAFDAERMAARAPGPVRPKPMPRVPFVPGESFQRADHWTWHEKHH